MTTGPATYAELLRTQVMKFLQGLQMGVSADALRKLSAADLRAYPSLFPELDYVRLRGDLDLIFQLLIGDER